MRAAFSGRIAAAFGGMTSDVVMFQSPSQRSNKAGVIRSRCFRWAAMGLPLYRPLVSTTDDQKATSFSKCSGHSSIASLKIGPRSDELTSELKSLMRTSYAVFRLKKHIEH